MIEDISQVRKVFEIRSQDGVRVASYPTLAPALVEVDRLNGRSGAPRDEATAYVVIEAYLTDFD